MEILGINKDKISRSIDWGINTGNVLEGKKIRTLAEKPKMEISLRDKENSVFVKDNCYYEVCDTDITLKLPLKINATINKTRFLGKNDFIAIKASTVDGSCYRIEVYDPVKRSGLSFGVPIYVFDFFLHLDNEFNNENLARFKLAIEYIAAQHLDNAINKILNIKNVDYGTFCVNKDSGQLSDIVNKDVLKLNFDTTDLLTSFIHRARQNFRERPITDFSIFGNFNIGLSPMSGDFLLIKLDNIVNPVSIFIGKVFSNLRKNCPMHGFTKKETDE